MKYSPKKSDVAARAIYSSCLIASLLCMMIGDSSLKSVFSSLGLVFLVASLFIFIKYESTGYEYILLERNSSFDFYINKLTGKRGSYVCYYPLTDCVKISKCENNYKEQIRATYGNVRFYSYVQNFISGKNIYYIVFKNESFFDCVTFEPDEEMFNLISKNIRLTENNNDLSQSINKNDKEAE